MPCVHERIEAQVARTPDAVAVVFEGQALTYRELDERANRVAHALRRFGAGPERLVGIAVERSLEMIVGLLGIWKSGSAYVPLDPSYPSARLAFMIEDAAAPLLLTQRRLAARLPSGRARVVLLDADGAIERESAAHTPSGARGDHLAYVIYTSGSTGRPKGAMNTHAGIENRLVWMQQEYSLTAADKVLQKTPISFDVSVWELFWPLMIGAQLVIARPDGHKDARYLIDLIERDRITTIHFVPSMLRELLETPGLGRCRSLRRVICSGEVLPVRLQERFFACLDAELHNLYGPTEASVDVTFFRCERGRARPTVPIGRAIANTQIYLLDESLAEVPVGAPGEIHVGGVGVGRGYLGRPALTAERFIPNPFGRGRLYKTGDLARRLPDGELEFLGRIDDQVKLRGFRIELGEIEAALVRHPRVRAAVVVARDDEPGDRRLVAYVVAEGAPLPAAELSSHLVATLPAHMVPSAFVALETLPLHPSGKVDRGALPAPVARTRSIAPPRKALERELVQIWEDVLGVPVGVTDSFFDLGGHSLLALRLMARIEKRYGVTLELASLLDGPTVERLAERVRRGPQQTPWSPLVLLHAGRTRPLFLVHAIGGNVLSYVKLAERLGADQTVYGLQARGLDGVEPPIGELREMAAYYVDMVRAIQPRGPYLLGGWSFGGTVAYEMAQQLRAGGERIALLALLEARATTTATREKLRHMVHGFDPALMAFWFTVITARCYGVEVGCSLANFTGLDEDERLARILMELERFQPTADASIAQLRTALRLFVTNLRSLCEYIPTSYPDPVTLFRARTVVEPLPDRPTPPPWGWEQCAPRIEYVDVNSSHFTLLHRDHVIEVGERLRECVERAHRSIH